LHSYLRSGQDIYFIKVSRSRLKMGIDILQNDPKILNKIGDFESYTFDQDSLPKETDNPARFKVKLNGSAASIYLKCTMQKGKSGKWFIQELKEDSLKKINSY